MNTMNTKNNFTNQTQNKYFYNKIISTDGIFLFFQIKKFYQKNLNIKMYNQWN